MKKIIMGMLAAASIAAPALADPIKDEEYFTMHSMGCMLLQECTDHVKELKTVSDLNKDDYLLHNKPRNILQSLQCACCLETPSLEHTHRLIDWSI